jgi:hypothetical protein
MFQTEIVDFSKIYMGVILAQYILYKSRTDFTL